MAKWVAVKSRGRKTAKDSFIAEHGLEKQVQEQQAQADADLAALRGTEGA